MITERSNREADGFVIHVTPCLGIKYNYLFLASPFRDFLILFSELIL